jgi:hypothetical protein
MNRNTLNWKFGLLCILFLIVFLLVGWKVFFPEKKPEFSLPVFVSVDSQSTFPVRIEVRVDGEMYFFGSLRRSNADIFNGDDSDRQFVSYPMIFRLRGDMGIRHPKKLTIFCLNDGSGLEFDLRNLEARPISKLTIGQRFVGNQSHWDCIVQPEKGNQFLWDSESSLEPGFRPQEDLPIKSIRRQ